jgi:predicted lipoprotein with Yx(FWY)xxD motif
MTMKRGFDRRRNSMNPKHFLVSLFMCSLGLASPVMAEPRIEPEQIVAHDGHTLYVFDNDVTGSGKSVCYGACANIFPPYLASSSDTAKAPWSFAMREDGSKQWAYKGRPLYRFYADERKGAVGGDGLNRKTWHVARP